MPEVKFKVKCQTTPGESVVVVGSAASTGDWDPTKSKVALKTDASSYPLWSGSTDLNGGSTLEFKFAVVKDGNARWEGIPNRSLLVPTGAVEVETEFDSQQLSQKQLNGSGGNGYTNGKPSTPAPAPAPAAAPAAAAPAVSQRPLPVSTGPASAFAERISKENGTRKSWRNKLDLSRVLLEDGSVSSLAELAGLQAYLTFVSSGAIKCEEDGGHHRPCAHAEASKKITQLLWQFAARGDAERFIARRIFPSLPSYADQFTAAVPMTRIRDIAHRGDIPHEMKQLIKNTLQNKLHRCADPGDLVTCQEILDKVHRENCYNQAFVKELEIFYVELKEFFNAGSLDEQARNVSNTDPGAKAAVDKLLHVKNNGGDPFGQMQALAELRRLSAPLAETQQPWLLLDLELEKYAFVLLSQLAGGLDGGGKGQPDWWNRLLQTLDLALAQVEMSGIAREECLAVARELRAVGPDAADPSKAPFAPQRVAASADRALRICFALCQSLEEAYAGVPALGKLLGIDGHAVSVFVEAEVRISVLFQVSKLVQMAMQSAKAAAGLPLWTAIAAGAAYGRILRCGSLSDAWSAKLPEEGVIIFCSEASGDEELPNLVRGVVVARDLPVLSHLALRARQLGVIFACTAEAQLFEEARAVVADKGAARLTVQASGGVRVEAISDEVLAKECAAKGSAKSAKDKQTGSKGGGAKKVGALSLAADKVLSVVELASSPQIAGAKAASSGKLEELMLKPHAAKFLAPKGLAVPFGVMRKAVASADLEKALASLQQALDTKSEQLEEKARAARDAVERCTVPKAVLDALMSQLPSGTLRVAVRSSANSEDLEGVSGAGLHDSVLGVDAKDSAELGKAVREVWSSLFTLRAVQSRHAAGMPLFEGIAMGVLVQPMVSLQGKAYAFIAFTKDVVAGDAGAVYLEVCVGLGETLASANEPGTPYRLVVRKAAPHEVKVLSLASYSYGLQDLQGGPARILVDYSTEKLSTDQAFLEKLARDVAAVAVRVEEGYGAPMDMEGVVLEQASGREVHLVQARPIVEG